MTHDDVQRWLERYVAAWTTYDTEAIGDLFSDEASYRYQPYSDPVVGREAIVASWLKEVDEPGTFDAHYDAWAVEDDLATGIGESRYMDPDGSFRTLYHNVFLLRFDGHGKCTEFVEYFMELPERLQPKA
jgi:SnoaL-like protein